MSSFIRDLRDNNRLSVTIILALSCLLSVSLVAFRIYYSGYYLYLFLVWNLFLAILPYVISTFFLLYYRKIKPLLVISVILFSWLLLFPNAPYIVTDFFHLEPKARVPYWFDLGLILSFAWNGLMLGFISLYDVQTALSRDSAQSKAGYFQLYLLCLQASVFIWEGMRDSTAGILLPTPFRFFMILQTGSFTPSRIPGQCL